MASGQTTNYGLNQWAAEDPVLRTDFNQDNAKLDAALERTNRCVKLVDRTLEQSDLARWDVDVSGIDFTQYYKIDLLLERPDLSQVVYMQLNYISNYSTNNFHINGDGNVTSYFLMFAAGNDTLCLFNPITANGYVHCMYVTHSRTNRSGSCCGSAVAWRELDTLSFYCDEDGSKPVPAGIRVIVYGYKR